MIPNPPPLGIGASCEDLALGMSSIPRFLSRGINALVAAQEAMNDTIRTAMPFNEIMQLAPMGGLIPVSTPAAYSESTLICVFKRVVERAAVMSRSPPRRSLSRMAYSIATSLMVAEYEGVVFCASAHATILDGRWRPF